MSSAMEPRCERCGADTPGGRQEELDDGRIRCGSCGHEFRPYGAVQREPSPSNSARRQELLERIEQALRRADADGRRGDAAVLYAASQHIDYLGREYDAERTANELGQP